MKTIQELYNEIMADKELKEKFIEATNAGKQEEFMKEHGCEATMEELKAFIQAKTQGDAPLSIGELEEAAGGVFQYDDEHWLIINETQIEPPKYCCPKCMSRNVVNYNPDSFFVMRVKCNDCGYFGCRGSISETKM